MLSWGKDADADHMSEKPGITWGWYDFTIAIALAGLVWAAVIAVGWAVWEMVR